MKTYVATKAEQTAQMVKLDEIDAKITPINLESVVAVILDFENDDITITYGGYDEIHRLITT